MVFGGDEAYPTVSPARSQFRLKEIFLLAPHMSRSARRRMNGEGRERRVAVDLLCGARLTYVRSPERPLGLWPAAGSPGRSRLVHGVPAVSERVRGGSMRSRKPRIRRPGEAATALTPRTRRLRVCFSATQRTTFFAARIYADWWLWGIDIALDQQINDEQSKLLHESREKET